MVYNMAESKGVTFTKVVQKKAGRAKERFLQNLGKADKTTDELFEVYSNNFNKQQNSATRLQKELKNYTTCMRAMQAANKGLMECLVDIYEPEWPGQDQIPEKADVLENAWEDICHKLNDQVTIPLSTYLSQFSEIKAKIAKRGRKLVDYDGCRHAFESLQASTKKRDDIKVAKTREQMEEARRLYEVLNKELHDELPALYDSRIPFLISTLQTLFASETKFHGEYSKVHAQFCELIDALAMEAQKGSYHTSARIISSSPNSTHKQDGNVRPYEEIDYKKSLDQENFNEVNRIHIPSSQANGDTVHIHLNQSSSIERENNLESPKMTSPSDSNSPSSPEQRKSDEVYDIPAGATTTDLPPGVLYKVRATYKYVAEDADELNFEAGDVIRVIEYEDPEEQEEGWLMGVKEANGEKGLFPANFTRPI